MGMAILVFHISSVEVPPLLDAETVNGTLQLARTATMETPEMVTAAIRVVAARVVA